MPLKIFRGGQKAIELFGFGTAKVPPGFRCDIGMGGFVVSENDLATTAIGTDGAGPCQIIVVHKTKGCGAIGHYPGDNRPEKVAQGVALMVQKLGGGPIESILLAAGLVGRDQKEQTHYTTNLQAHIASMCKVGTIRLPEPPDLTGSSVWDSCYYFPLEEEVALLEDCPGVFYGDGDGSGNGIRKCVFE